jgi:hypothetical protein
MPTTAAAIQEPCQSGIVVSLTLETPFGNPMPEISSVEQDVKNDNDPSEIAVSSILARDFFEGLKLIG